MAVHNHPPAQQAQPIPCTSCMRTFSRRPDLIRHHREVHENEKFPCGYDGCNYDSTRRERTRKHREKKHPGWFTRTTELNTENTMQNQAHSNYPNSQASVPGYSSSFQAQSNQTYGESTTGWYDTPESAESAAYTTTVSHDQQTSYSSPNPSVSPHQTTTSGGSSYGNGWGLGRGAPQQDSQWNSTDNGWENGCGQDYP